MITIKEDRKRLDNELFGLVKITKLYLLFDFLPIWRVVLIKKENRAFIGTNARPPE